MEGTDIPRLEFGPDVAPLSDEVRRELEGGLGSPRRHMLQRTIERSRTGLSAALDGSPTSPSLHNDDVNALRMLLSIAEKKPHSGVAKLLRSPSAGVNLAAPSDRTLFQPMRSLRSRKSTNSKHSKLFQPTRSLRSRKSTNSKHSKHVAVQNEINNASALSTLTPAVYDTGHQAGIYESDISFIARPSLASAQSDPMHLGERSKKRLKREMTYRYLKNQQQAQQDQMREDLEDAMAAVQELCAVAQQTEAVTEEIEDQNRELRAELAKSQEANLYLHVAAMPSEEREEVLARFREYEELIAGLQKEKLEYESQVEELKAAAAASTPRSPFTPALTHADAFASHHATLLWNRIMSEDTAEFVDAEVQCDGSYTNDDDDREDVDGEQESLRRTVKSMERKMKEHKETQMEDQAQCARLLEHIEVLENEKRATMALRVRETERTDLHVRDTREVHVRDTQEQHSEFEDLASKLLSAQEENEELRKRIADISQSQQDGTSEEPRLRAEVESLKRELGKSYVDVAGADILNAWSSIDNATRILSTLALSMQAP